DGNEVLGLVVDGDIGAEIPADLAFVSTARRRDHTSTEGLGELYGRGADAARAAMDEKPVASIEPAALEDVVPDREVGLGHAASLGHGEALGNGERRHLLGDAVFGITTAVDERADLVANLPARHACANCCDLTGNLETGKRRMAG